MIPKVLHRERFPLTQLWIVVILLVPATSLGTEAENPAGHWKGAVEILGTKLEVRINLEHSAAGWKGKISIPAQNAKDLPLNNVTVADAEITFDLPGMPGSPSFRGTMSDDRRQISGDFTQFRQTFRFLLERSEDLATAAEQALAGLDGLIQQALGDWMVPGLAVGIVTDDEIVYARGFGMRDVGQKLPVTTKTLFAIGSCTKAFTTFVMGTLVDEGKLDWDRPVAGLPARFQAL